MENIGKLIFGIGLILMAVGLLFWFNGNRLSWLGSLPGDIKIERPGFSFYFPIVTSIRISFILSFVVWLIARLTR